jgi:membrane protein implicated in regulation of membrane protease activity
MAHPRSPRASTRASRSHPGAWALIALLLAAAIVGTLWVPFYDRATPALGGFPFFYWYQLLWVPVVAILTALAYLLTKRVTRTTTTASPSRGPDSGEEA